MINSKLKTRWVIAAGCCLGMLASTGCEHLENGVKAHWSKSHTEVVHAAQQVNTLYNNYPAADRAARKSLPTIKNRNGDWNRQNRYRLIPILNNHDVYSGIERDQHAEGYYIWQAAPEEVYMIIPVITNFHRAQALLGVYNFCNNTKYVELAAAVGSSSAWRPGQKCYLLPKEDFDKRVCAQVPVCANSRFNYPSAKKKSGHMILYRFEGDYEAA